ncbi:Dihydroxyacetone kinase 2 [Wickerhamiella sorbophila]|uniref:Dihydroxyacetone kinase 2 n=1 Tax=Wickerhamiella sorbophila TaxID=45607 RepID=A0A2T0FI54_9ASCO|nr:Dihydroxyacetone kinase 2 [Wickerhamiella sorbophila]PRT54670.1 Dihydroxyacetone kinase 2 [Wickerhamiella sorbophila]
MKQFKHSRDQDLVSTSLDGLVSANPSLAHLNHNVVVYRPSYKSNPEKVTLISGGGSGHEPTHTGFIGEGMLDAVAVGQIFASPTAVQIEHALDAVSSPKGTLIIVKNYTGDVFHFGAAAEKAKAAGKSVRVVIVGDDVAVGREQGALVGRRGLAGVILVHKTAGASAQQGHDLATVAHCAELVARNIATIGTSLEHCTIPGRKFHSDLKDDEYEIGLGIHNEPGVIRESHLPELPKVIDRMLRLMTDQNDKDRAFVKFQNGDDVLLLVNNLGGVSPFEISYITSIALRKVEKLEFRVRRVLAGTFTTSFNGLGFSLTLLNLTSAGPKILDLIDLQTPVPGWTNATASKDWDQKPISEGKFEREELPESGILLPKGFEANLNRGLRALIAAEPQITEYDTMAGDGDCGETLKAGAEALMNKFDSLPSDAVLAILEMADVLGEAMGGTSGGIYFIFLTALAKNLRECGVEAIDPLVAGESAKGALITLFEYTKARKGDRTLIDALQPFIDTLCETSSISEALRACQEGMESTAKLTAKAGRAAYVQQDNLVKENIPDPGAYGLFTFLQAWCDSEE